jgi:hypothetical protein
MVTVKSLDLSTFTNSDTIFANQDSATYQWVDCNNAFTAIPGETDQYFKVSANGDYAVIISYDGCTDTSACVNMVVTDLDDKPSDPILVIFPNPNDGNFKFLISNFNKDIQLEIRNLHGQMIFEESIISNAPTFTKEFNLTMLPKGVYLINFRSKGFTVTRKLVIK